MGWDGYKTLCRRNLERLAENVYLRVAFLSWRKKRGEKGNDGGKKRGRKRKGTPCYTITCAILHGFFFFFGGGTTVTEAPNMCLNECETLLRLLCLHASGRDELQFLQHILPRAQDQCIHILVCQALGINRIQNLL